MILSDIKQYLSHRGCASLSDISIHFDTDPDAMRGMLGQWIRKGYVRRDLTNTSCGGSCNKCDTANTEIYRWLDSTNNSLQGIRIKTEGRFQQTTP